jgi:enamine deaminase RidA (YjgF/YER057c/UK114 family)
MRRTVMADKGPAPAGPYSHAVVANGFTFVSDHGAVNPETGNMLDASADQVLPKSIERIESLRSALRFQVPLEGNSVNELEVMR